MEKNRTGVWIFGAKGGLATTLMVGTLAIARDMTSSSGLVTEREELGPLGLVAVGDLVFGGHDIREMPLYDSAYEIYRETGSINYEILLLLKEEVDRLNENMRPGICINCGSTVEGIADGAFSMETATLEESVAAIQADMRAFKEKHQLERLVAVNLASTEPILEVGEPHQKIESLRTLIQENRTDEVRASLVYAYAAMDMGCAYINFTPSNAALVPAMEALAEERKIPYMGNDGKTGETLVKSVLAPMFKYRNLKVLSWQGYNILGDRDGMVLANEENRAAKVQSKDHLLAKILGYPLHTHVGIDYVASLKDMKTAWDFIHFKGFMDFKMSMQFIWQGCDAILAAPIVLDMIRLTDFAVKEGEWGRMVQLSSFFKSPLGVKEHDLHFQFHALLDYITSHLERMGHKP